MSGVNDAGTKFNPITGEVIPPEEDAPETPNLPAQPVSVALGRELDKLPEEFGELAQFFAEPEPSAREVIAWIMGTEEMEDTDPEQTSRSIMARILMTETAEEMLVANRVTHAQEILGVPLEITAVKWQRSRFEEGGNVYAVFTANVVGTDEAHTVTCSGRNVMVMLLNAHHRGFLPLRCMVQQASKPTANGYYPLWLQPA